MISWASGRRAGCGWAGGAPPLSAARAPGPNGEVAGPRRVVESRARCLRISPVHAASRQCPPCSGTHRRSSP
ncbi:hypothetical protein FM110_03415 [Brachybacterium nesterenkovii]|uniref:Uncharacterized protein n=1 Tax=Brachybacterium nesterenkovii TaxID=47847 RepID=A0A1X6WV80_9MICO|nr:hypothetical protein FM110_03415 [Brachybacterium nesterenkovii]